MRLPTHNARQTHLAEPERATRENQAAVKDHFAAVPFVHLANRLGEYFMPALTPVLEEAKLHQQSLRAPVQEVTVNVPSLLPVSHW